MNAEALRIETGRAWIAGDRQRATELEAESAQVEYQECLGRGVTTAGSAWSPNGFMDGRYPGPGPRTPGSKWRP